MSQSELDFKTKREAIKRSLRAVEGLIHYALQDHPSMRELKNSNELIRFMWNTYSMNIKAESILRAARKIRAEHPELDTEENQLERANCEVAYREHNQNS